ncbi:MAG: hypothetical protein AAGA77_07025 [Bacteroidota bacterium]
MINNKILISITDEQEKIYLGSESLFSDEVVDTDSLTEDIKVVHFWGSWCVGCLKNFPALTSLADQHSHIQMIGVCVDWNKDQAIATAEKYCMDWKNLYYTFNDQELKSRLIFSPIRHILLPKRM